VSAPLRLETERLVLREFVPEDAPFVLELLHDPGWLRFIGDRGVDSLESARTYIENVPRTSYRAHGFGLMAVEKRDDGEPVGMCGLVQRDGLDHADLGFALLARHAGRGYALEAAAATLADARDRLRLARVLAITTPDNERSQRLLEQLGMRFERMVRLSTGGDPLRLYALDLESLGAGVGSSERS